MRHSARRLSVGVSLAGVCALCFGGSSAAQTPFRVKPGALANSLVIHNDENISVGIGTDDPLAGLHISGFPRVVLEDTQQIWSVDGGNSRFEIVDITDDGSAPFVIQKGARAASIVISDVTDGPNVGSFVGLGTLNDPPEAHLHIRGDEFSSILLEAKDTETQWAIVGNEDQFNIVHLGNGNLPGLTIDTATGDMGLGDFDPSADFAIERLNGMAVTFSRVNAGEANFTTSSSRELKENIQPYVQPDLVERVSKVPVCTYDWKGAATAGDVEHGTNRLGLIAEEFHTILGRGSDKEINGQEVQMVLWMAVQELHAREQSQRQLVQQQRQALEGLQQQNQELARRLSALEARLTKSE